MLRVEMKRVLKTRSTWGLFAIAFALSLFFAFYTIRHEAYYQYENGRTEIIRGSKAYELKQDRYDITRVCHLQSKNGGLWDSVLYYKYEIFLVFTKKEMI